MILPFNIDHLKSRIESQGYVGTNNEYLFDRDKYMDYINSEHLAPKLDYEDLEEIRISNCFLIIIFFIIIIIFKKFINIILIIIYFI